MRSDTRFFCEITMAGALRVCMRERRMVPAESAPLYTPKSEKGEGNTHEKHVRCERDQKKYVE